MKSCLDCYHFKLTRKKTMKHPTLECSMGIHRGKLNHPKKFVLTREEDRDDGYFINVIPEFLIAKKCGVFESMDD